MPRAQAVWRADEVPRAALAQKPAVFLAHHAAIHDPHALRLAVIFLHRVHDFLHGGHVGAVAREDFVGKRLPLGRADRPDADLFAVGPRIARTERSEIAKGRSLCPKGSAGGRWQ